MYVDHLRIPLNQSPTTRHQPWRVVWLLGLTVSAVATSLIAFSLWNYRPSLTQMMPEGTTGYTYLTINNRTRQILRQDIGQTQLLPAGPWSLGQFTQVADHALVIFYNDTEVLGVAFDGPTEISLPGYETTPVARGVVVHPSATALTQRHGAWQRPWPLLPVFEGFTAAYQPGQGFGTNAPLSLAPGSLTIYTPTSFAAPGKNISLGQDAKYLLSLHLPPAYAAGILPYEVPLAFPGTRTLLATFSAQGGDLLLGEDAQGVAFSFATQAQNWELQELGQITKESVEVRTLSTLEWTIQDTTHQEMRSSQDITVDFYPSTEALIAIAKSPDNRVFRLTQTATDLIGSNRNAEILTKNRVRSSCAPKTQAFLRPADLAKHLAPTTAYSELSLPFTLRTVEEIAFSKHSLKICW